MKFYSEKTKKFYDTAEDCQNDESALVKKQAEEELRQKKLKEERAGRAKEVEEAYKAIFDAKLRYNELKNKFIEDYGSFHQSFNLKTELPKNFSIGDWSDLFNLVFDI